MSDKRVEIIERVIGRSELPEFDKTDQNIYEFVDLIFEYIEDEDKTVAFMNDLYHLLESLEGEE